MPGTKVETCLWAYYFVGTQGRPDELVVAPDPIDGRPVPMVLTKTITAGRLTSAMQALAAKDGRTIELRRLVAAGSPLATFKPVRPEETG